MRLSKTISRLSKVRKSLDSFAPPEDAEDRLSNLHSRAPNPGNLRASCYLPDDLPAGSPLVVVLHGCTQNAAGYDHGSGWSRLADRHGFALLYPEQQRGNNANLCFNWFEPGDTMRGQGEAASIAAMIGEMTRRHSIDPKRVFITGLSAGGAMASAMLATYPELFAAGAIIAGLPYGCATSVAQAFGCMSGRDRLDSRTLGARVGNASPHKGPWPRISVWQGSADQTVVPSNADAVVRQWTNVHGLAARPAFVENVAGHPRRVWRSADGADLIEQYLITGMGHGTPLAPGSGPGRSGAAGAHMLDVGLSSTDRIAAFWGIAPAAAEAHRRAAPATAAEPARTGGVQQAIEDALRTAGLMR